MNIAINIMLNKRQKNNFTKCLKYQPCDVIKMREMRGGMTKETLKKEVDNLSFL